MELHFTSKLEEYYQKFIELQEQLKKSEEQRFLLEMKFNQMVQVAKEEEQQHFRKLRAQYKRFLEEDKKRQDRNERLIRNLERIETRIAMLSSKTERINLLRKQYQNFLLRIANGNRQRKPPDPGISRERSFIREEPLKEQHANLFKDDFSLPQRHKDTLELDKSVFEHPTMKRALEKDQSNEEKIEILDKYLQSLSSQRCRDLLNQEKESRGKLTLGTQQDVYGKGEPSTTNHATSIADDIMNSIYSRYYNKKDGLTRESQLNFETVGQNDNKKVPRITKVGDFDRSKIGNELESNSSMPSDSSKNQQDIAGRTVSPIVDTRVTSNVEDIFEHTKPNLGDFKPKNSIERNPNQIEEQNTFKLKDQKEGSCKDDNISSSSGGAQNDDALLKTESEDSEESKEVLLDLMVQENNQELRNNTVDKPPSISEAQNEEPIINEDETNSKPDLVSSDTDKNLSEYHQNDNINTQNSYELNDHDHNIQFDLNVPTKIDDKKPLKQDDHNNLIVSEQVDAHESLDDNHPETAEETNGQHPAIQTEANQDTIVQHPEHDISQSHSYHETNSTQQNDYYNTDQIQEDPQVQYEQSLEQQIYEENEQPIPYDPTDPSAYQQHYDENGQPIQYDEHGQGYDQYGQLLFYDQNGQMVQPQYDEHGQIIPQYDESGQLIMLYDQNGHQQYDENGQPFLQYDASGQPIYGLDQTDYNFVNQDGLYQEGNQQGEVQPNDTENAFYQEGNQECPVPEDIQLKGDAQKGDQEYTIQPKEAEQNEVPVTEANGDNHEAHNTADVPEKEESESKSAAQNNNVGNEVDEKVAKVMDILDTDTESSKQNSSKMSNDTDFDFS